jgi:hypothetical protein
LRTINQQLVSAVLVPEELWDKVEKTEEVLDKFAIFFSVFCAENTFNYFDGKWRMKELKPTFKTTEELLTIFKET